MSTQPDESGARPDDVSTPSGARPDAAAGEGREAQTSAASTQSLNDEGKQALDRERNARREAERRASDAERRLHELEDQGKSEIERAIARLDRQAAELDSERSARAELEKKLAERDLLELKRQIAQDMGVPLEAAHRLHGDDSRSIRADAQKYLDERAPAQGDLGVGRGGAAGRRGADINQIIREASGRHG